MSKFAKLYSTGKLIQERADKIKDLNIDDKIRMALAETSHGGEGIGDGDSTEVRDYICSGKNRERTHFKAEGDKC